VPRKQQLLQRQHLAVRFITNNHFKQLKGGRYLPLVQPRHFFVVALVELLAQVVALLWSLLGTLQ
jgi:hypothetical protein